VSTGELQMLEHVRSCPERSGDVVRVVASVCITEFVQRSIIGPLLEETALVPRVDGWTLQPRPPGHQFDHEPLQMGVTLGFRHPHFAPTELLRRQDHVVPEVLRDLVELRL